VLSSLYPTARVHVASCLCRSLELSGSADVLSQLCLRHVQYFDESFHLAVEHRLVHEHDGKPPPESAVRTLLSAGEPVRSRHSKRQLQQSATITDARSKFEQVLRASRQAAAAESVATTSSACTQQTLTTDGASAAPRWQNTENGSISSLLNSQ